MHNRSKLVLLRVTKVRLAPLISLPREVYSPFAPALCPSTLRGGGIDLYRMVKKAIQLCEVTYIRLLLRVGIKVVDEWQISLGYVRGSNSFVRGYLDLRAWSLRLRT